MPVPNTSRFFLRRSRVLLVMLCSLSVLPSCRRQSSIQADSIDLAKLGDSLILDRYPGINQILKNRGIKIIQRKWSEDSTPIFVVDLEATPQLRSLERFDSLALTLLDSSTTSSPLTLDDPTHGVHVVLAKHPDALPTIDYGDSLAYFQLPKLEEYPIGQNRAPKSLTRLLKQLSKGEPTLSFDCSGGVDVNGSLFYEALGLEDYGSQAGPHPIGTAWVDARSGKSYRKIDEHTLVEFNTQKRIHFGYSTSDRVWRTLNVQCRDPDITAYAWQIKDATGMLQRLNLDEPALAWEAHLDSTGIEGSLVSVAEVFPPDSAGYHLVALAKIDKEYWLYRTGQGCLFGERARLIHVPPLHESHSLRVEPNEEDASLFPALLLASERIPEADLEWSRSPKAPTPREVQPAEPTEELLPE